MSASHLYSTESLPLRGICSHRGANATHPENTIPAFREAVRRGARQIEFDVQQTKDGVLVVMHDTTVDRTTDGRGRVRDLSFDEIRKLDAGAKKNAKFTGTKVPTFEEVMEVLPDNVWINIHLKDEKAAVSVARKLLEMKRLHQAFLACSRTSAQAAIAAVPGILICNMERQGADVSRYIRETIAWKCAFIQLAGRTGAPEEMAALKKAGIRINFFGVRSPEHFRELVEAGVDFPLIDDMEAYRRVAAELGLGPFVPN